MSERSIEERTEFLKSVRFDFEQRQGIERVMEWVADNPDDAAAYIVWLQSDWQQEPDQ